MRTCRAIRDGDACGRPARYRVGFVDGQTVGMCEPCLVHLRELAKTIGGPETPLDVARLASEGASP
jgi:hypothetical protein